MGQGKEIDVHRKIAELVKRAHDYKSDPSSGALWVEEISIELAETALAKEDIWRDTILDKFARGFFAGRNDVSFDEINEVLDCLAATRTMIRDPEWIRSNKELNASRGLFS